MSLLSCTQTPRPLGITGDFSQDLKGTLTSPSNDLCPSSSIRRQVLTDTSGSHVYSIEVTVRSTTLDLV